MAKYKYCYILQGNWGSHGWEDLGEAEKKNKKDVQKLQQLLTEHRLNSKGEFRIIERRIRQ